jgi:hypothetical protein
MTTTRAGTSAATNRIGTRVSVTVVTSPAPPGARGNGSRRRGAAVALAVGAVVAVGVQLGTGWAIHTDRLPLRDPIYFDKLELMRARPGFAHADPSGARPLRVVFLGSSRSVDGIDAGAIGTDLAHRLGRPVEAFNFAHPGAGPVMNAVYLRRLLNDGVKPDAVVIEIHPALLAAHTQPPEAAWFATIRLRPEELSLVRRFGFSVNTPAAHGCRGWLLPWYEYRVPMIDRYATQLTVFSFPVASRQLCDEYGFYRCREVNPEERAKLLERTHKQYESAMNNYRPGGHGLVALRDMLETCRAATIRAALVLTPESSEFRNWYPEPGRSQIVPVLSDLAREFDCPLFDCREWLPDELIGDGHHLTGPGADAFTAKLASDALAPWLASPQRGKP